MKDLYECSKSQQKSVDDPKVSQGPSKKFTNEGISYWPGSEHMTINIPALRRVLCL